MVLTPEPPPPKAMPNPILTIPTLQPTFKFGHQSLRLHRNVGQIWLFKSSPQTNATPSPLLLNLFITTPHTKQPLPCHYPNLSIPSSTTHSLNPSSRPASITSIHTPNPRFLLWQHSFVFRGWGAPWSPQAKAILNAASHRVTLPSKLRLYTVR